MKKIILLLGLVIILLSSCVNKTGKNANWDIDKNLETEMCSIYREKLYNHMLITPDLETFIQYHFGDYNGNPVVYMGHTKLVVSLIPNTVEIDGYTFTFPSDQYAVLYKDSVFYSLETAYELGYLKIDDIKSLGKRIEEDFDKHFAGCDVREPHSETSDTSKKAK